MRPTSEYSEVLGGPLPIKRLAQIWASLPERERLGFYHALDEHIADQLMAATVKAADTQQRAADVPFGRDGAH